MKKVGWSSILVAVVLLAVGVIAEAQHPTKIPRIGVLAANPFSGNTARIEAFKQGLRELGYVEGKNIVIEWRSAEGKRGREQVLAAELVSLKVDVIVTLGPSQNPIVKKATTTIPIVMTREFDPVAIGLVASLARPGGNITGLSTLAPELRGKQLELLKEIVPKLSRVAVLGNSAAPGNADADALKELNLAAEVLKLQLQYLDVLSPKDIETSFQSASQERAGAVLVLGSRFMGRHRAELVDLAAKNRLPAMYPDSRWVVRFGGLMTYSPDLTDLSRRAATYVDKILRGAKPADLPVEQPTKFELVINLKAAKKLGITIPPSILYRADKVIK